MDLREITPENHDAVRRLAVHPDQRELVATVEKSLADAYVYKAALFRAAFVDDAPVGYVLVFPFARDDERVVNITRLMIDAAHQGRGLGRALLEETLRWVESFETKPDLVRISTIPGNEAALALYRSVGFEEAGLESGEVALYRAVSDAGGS